MGDLVAAEIAKAGGIAREFHSIAVDDGIAMGHDGMLYSLPSRDVIADSVEYMVNAHCADALVHFKLRQNHTGHVNGSHASQYSHNLCVRWAHGSG